MNLAAAEDVYIFRHALVRDAAYELQLPSERGHLHRLALELIQLALPESEHAGVSMELANHARFALPAADTESAETELLEAERSWLEVAAAHFKQSGQVHDELAALDRLACHPRFDSKLQRKHALQAADCFARLGRPAVVEQRCRALLDAARADDDRENIARAVVLLIAACAELGRPLGFEVDFEALAEDVRAVPELHAHALYELAEHQLAARRHDEAVATLDRAATYAKDQKLGTWHAFLMHRRASMAQDRGQSEQALAETRESVRLAEAAGDKLVQAQAYNNLGIIYAETMRADEATDAYVRAEQLAEAVGARGLQDTIMVNHGNLHLYYLGNLSRAEAYYLRSREVCLENGRVSHLSTSSYRLGVLNLTLGKYQQATEYLREARSAAERVGEPRGAMRNNLALAQAGVEMPLAERMGLFAGALRWHAEQGDSQACGEVLFRAANALGQLGLLSAFDEASALAIRLFDRDSSGGPLYALALGARAEACLLSGDAAQAEELAREAASRFDEAIAHHRASAGNAFVLAAEMQRAVGLIGVERPDSEALARMESLAAMIVKDSSRGEYSRTVTVSRARLIAEAVSALRESAPPYGLFMGLPPRAIPGPMIHALLERAPAEQMQAANPRLWAALNELRTPTCVAHDTPLFQVPGLEGLEDALSVFG